MKRCRAAIALVSLMFALSGCGGNTANETSDFAATEIQTEQEEQDPVVEKDGSAHKDNPVPAQEAPAAAQLTLSVDGESLDVVWEDNDSVAALQGLVESQPLEIQMSMYGGFEQVGSIGADLPRSDEQTTTQAGDIVLYQGNQIVIFYGSNSWAYTRLGHIEGKNAEELEQLLGEHDVALTLEVK